MFLWVHPLCHFPFSEDSRLSAFFFDTRWERTSYTIFWQRKGRQEIYVVNPIKSAHNPKRTMREPEVWTQISGLIIKYNVHRNSINYQPGGCYNLVVEWKIKFVNYENMMHLNQSIRGVGVYHKGPVLRLSTNQKMFWYPKRVIFMEGAWLIVKSGKSTRTLQKENLVRR